MDEYLGMVEHAISEGVRVRCHLEDVTRADIDGFVIPFVQRVMGIADQAPEELKPRIRLCDTLGLGISYPGAALPRSIPKLVYKMVHECDVPHDRLEWHGHNDFHRVHANASTAWLYGCNAANGTLFGYGERTGNPPVEGAIMEYIALKGELNGIDPTVITELVETMRSIGFPIPDNYPFVGRYFNTTCAGIHAGGLRYHGMAPIVCHLYKLGLVEARAVPQVATFQSGVQFARTEGIVPAPEPNHAIKVVIDEAIACKEAGESKTILLALSGHGHFDLAAYDEYLTGKLEDYAYSEEKVKESLAQLPQVDYAEA